MVGDEGYSWFASRPASVIRDLFDVYERSHGGPSPNGERHRAELQDQLRRARDGDWQTFEHHLRLLGSSYARTGLALAAWYEIANVFSKGVKIEVGDMLPSSHYAERLKRVPKAWEKAFEVNNASDEAMRASCVEFILNGLYASDRIWRVQKHGRITYAV